METDPLTILTGDALDQLRALPSESVHCCVCSPPYWGLRDYGVDGQLGLEKTPEEYVSKMVEVFREVRRVLRKDGTLWLNLGSSYASGDMRASQSLRRERVPACGSDDIEPQDSQNAGRVCPDSCDESRDEIQSHSRRNVHSDQSGEQDEQPTSQIVHDNERLDSASTSPDASLRGVRASKPRASFRRDRVVCVPSATASVYPKESRSSSDDAPQSSDNSCLNFTRFSQYIKPKDMVPIPWMVAMALQKDGWFLRQDCIWSKLNPMPESVTDRCTKAHEYLFLLTKSARYFYDAEAIKEPLSEATLADGRLERNGDYETPYGEAMGKAQGLGRGPRVNGTSRNKRSIWTVATAPYPEAHFATYPPDLIKPCILAGTSAKGCCAKCGAPWERITEIHDPEGRLGKGYHNHENDLQVGQRGVFPAEGRPEKKTLGWKPTCECKELYCPQCCVVIASNDDEKSITKGWSKAKMFAMRGEIFRTGQAKQMVFAGLRGEMDSEESANDNRQDDDDQGICDALPSEPSEREGRRLRDGTSRDNGKGDWSLFERDGSGSSSQSQEGGQSLGEFGTDDETGSRQDEETEASEVCAMSPLPENDILDWICGTCRDPLERRTPETVPSVVLDCFAGSGTTGAVALELGRKVILIELNPKYVELINRRCDITPGLALA